VEFVRAGVTLPVPFAVGAPRPAGGIDLPEAVALGLHSAVGLEAALIGIRPVNGSDRASDESLRWTVRSALRDFLQEPQRLEGLLGALLKFGAPQGRVGEA